MKILSTLLFAMLVITSCGNKPNAEKLSGEFHIISLDQNSELPENLTITFDAETKKISGFSGCNNFFGSFTVTDGVLQFGQMGSTRKMCAGDANKIETEMLQMLSKVNTFSFENDTLNLKVDDAILLKAKK
ncbi:META domain-containing protein [Algibacter lectus]|uniref:META domain-containing protein n=1 Tax=Algibacter lectus TaxID=221126 RepID=UPI0008E99F5F|nr:META domain-containing protein [Algibacter lectus]SFC95865.1 META domain-containing protein [Algibacter lectus]